MKVQGSRFLAGQLCDFLINALFCQVTTVEEELLYNPRLSKDEVSLPVNCHLHAGSYKIGDYKIVDVNVFRF